MIRATMLLICVVRACAIANASSSSSSGAGGGGISLCANSRKSDFGCPRMPGNPHVGRFPSTIIAPSTLNLI